MIKNREEKLIPAKHRKRTPGGPPNASKIDEHASRTRPKLKKVAQKMVFGGFDVLMIFWIAKT